MLQQCHSLNCLLQDCRYSRRDPCQPGPSRQLLNTATWTLQNRLDMRSFSCLTIRARDGALLFRIGEIFDCHSGGCSQPLVRDTVKIPVPIQCVFPIERSFIAMWTWYRESCLTSLQPEIAQSRMLIRTPPKRPMIFSLRFFERKIIDARVPAPHQPMFIKFPILVTV
jgi:hypothetical protein